MISIDVFDTAIFRNVYKPTDIFKIINDEEFYEKRVEAEIKAREKDPYFNLDDIYETLPRYDKEVEIKAEFCSIEANPVILRVYNATPQKFVFISDMYLSSKIIKDMLVSVGYKDPKVFVSQELKACKATGELFTKVEKKIKEKITLHYGDNYLADIEGAKKAGIKAVFNPALKDIDLNLPEVKDPYLKNYVARALLNHKEEVKEMEVVKPIAKIITPMLLDFTKWVLSKRKSEDTKILFLARDMNLPYRIAKDVYGAKNIEYVYASRKSMAKVVFNSGDKMFSTKLKWIMEEDKGDLKEIMNYFTSLNIKDGDIIVDIGYSGTAHFAIQRLLGVKLKGLYMQKEKIMHKELDVDMYFNRNVIKFPLLVESFISSSEDCLIGYKKGVPVFSEDSGKRKYYARIVEKEVFRVIEDVKDLKIRNFDLFDLEQVLIYLQLYCPDEFLDVYNIPLITNRSLKESVINYDREGIKVGMLKELYESSYAKPLFLRMLRKDKELSNLEKYLT